MSLRRRANVTESAAAHDIRLQAAVQDIMSSAERQCTKFATAACDRTYADKPTAIV